jgi:hypothetical protein
MTSPPSGITKRVALSFIRPPHLSQRSPRVPQRPLRSRSSPHGARSRPRWRTAPW